MAFPGTSNFIGELLIMFGLIEKNILVLFAGKSPAFGVHPVPKEGALGLRH